GIGKLQVNNIRPARFGLTSLLVLVALGAPSWCAPDEPRVAVDEDPYLWLEDIDGARQLAWVNDHNSATQLRLAALPGYDSLFRDALAVLDSTLRLPEVTQRGGWLYNLWRDRAHPRGLFRRATLAE